jgi:putative flippase GtrA
MKRFAKFCVVGLCNTIITFLTYYLLVEAAHANYMISSFTGYIFGVANSFAMNKRWTFHNADTRVVPQFIRFIFINIISLGANLSILYLNVEGLGIDKMIAQLIAMIFSIGVNFLGSSLLVFKTKKCGVENEDNLQYIK